MRKAVPTPLKAMRAKCLDCAGRPKEVRHCPAIDCPLWPFRMGKNPNRKGIGPGTVIITPKNRVESDKTIKDEVINERFGSLCNGKSL